ncbi:MAG: GNAT family N-acetyltransferase [Aphanocapsa sp. GSE-SYN-MK-11-07L]|jgi:GNAT superfamily N-acetyltransferase|nr:GNAT family N-acetyltransferase [Aphanocapsa sp. GSE-SYN-MK-11-07L]
MQVRPAQPNEIPLIFSFIQKKAEFDRRIGAYSGRLQVTAEKLSKTLFVPIPFSYVLFAEQPTGVVGFALYGFRYSSFVGQPSLWLDDLYVDEPNRSQGTGTVLMNTLAEVAEAHDCTHLAWTADARNQRGLNFYNQIGATIAEQTGDRCLFTWNP